MIYKSLLCSLMISLSIAPSLASTFNPDEDGSKKTSQPLSNLEKQDLPPNTPEWAKNMLLLNIDELVDKLGDKEAAEIIKDTFWSCGDDMNRNSNVRTWLKIHQKELDNVFISAVKKLSTGGFGTHWYLITGIDRLFLPKSRWGKSDFKWDDYKKHLYSDYVFEKTGPLLIKIVKEVMSNDEKKEDLSRNDNRGFYLPKDCVFPIVREFMQYCDDDFLKRILTLAKEYFMDQQNLYFNSYLGQGESFFEGKYFSGEGPEVKIRDLDSLSNDIVSYLKTFKKIRIAYEDFVKTLEAELKDRKSREGFKKKLFEEQKLNPEKKNELTSYLEEKKKSAESEEIKDENLKIEEKKDGSPSEKKDLKNENKNKTDSKKGFKDFGITFTK